MKNPGSLVIRFVDVVDELSTQLGGWMIAFIMILTGADVFMRAVLNRAMEASYTLSELMMVAICFLSLGYTQKQTSHISMDFVVARLKERWSTYIELFSLSLSLIICVLLTYRAMIEAIVAVDLRLVTPGVTQWPAWPSKIIVVYGFLLLSIRILIQFLKKLGRAAPKG